ncbi:peptidase inhibitor family I36 protein [Streptantibioticus cattleyicolor]|uniref:Peptidase inhibitor n=1 Tax=Streptantibioticus cattleyicolor (strain ATCC 35852 / DSM 46488 / JCM 4925 / NBRC 14057 / NRRL 8057) TaxID=1003195 RepID=F8JIZ4_STREN|nr:peptidase inhibitor family I36 protein [Streptantibioticus cattleyicolor]AEW98917.1 hypothetical protein SCATT_p07240 [Streptantibioticus cattleyicolor NRRL 8057 = DSM 46488]CCB72036.1 putative peptidase inhibitor [Streptantibioticus cattleyicolor NRRL 8057 = DSM 46488]
MRILRAAMVAFGATALLATGVAPAASATPATSGYDRCPEGYFCEFSWVNGEGSICKWKEARTYDTYVKCPWAPSANVRSVFNNGPRKREYFLSTNFRDRVGSTGPNGRGNLTGSYKIRSHRWA